MKQKQFMGAMLACLLMLLLTGCGQSMTLEEKVAEVQGKNEITTQDVVQLMKLEGLSVEKQKVSAEFAELCPDTEVYKVNGDNLLLMKATEGSLYDRDKELQEKDWNHYWFDQENPSAALQQLQKDCGLEKNKYYSGRDYAGKNIIAGYFANIDVELFEENVTQEVAYEKMEAAAALAEKVSHVFDYDINGIREYAVTAEGKYFSVAGTLYFSQTPYTAGKSTMYDVFTDIRYTATVKDEIFAKYQGQDMTLESTGPINNIIGTTGAVRQSGQLLEKKLYSGQNDNRNIIGQEYTGPIQYEVTFSVGDISETLIVGVDEAVAAKATAPAEK